MNHSRTTRIVRLAAIVITVLAAPAVAADVLLYVVAGQSNALGSGAAARDLPTSLRRPQSDVLFGYEEGQFGAVYHPTWRITSGSTFIALQPQSDPVWGAFEVDPGFGPEIGLGRRLADSLADDIAVVKFAFNATSLVEHWNPDAPNLLYAQLLSFIQTSRNRLAAMGRTHRLAGFCWMQGEADAWDTDAVAAAYRQNLARFIARLRSDLASPRLPFVLGRLHADIWMSPYGITPARLAAVRAAQDTVSQTLPATASVNTDDLPLAADHIHYVAAGERTMGERFADACLRIAAQARGDLDNDGDADGADLGVFGSCFNGTGRLVTGACLAADLNGDSHVDGADYGVFAACFNGSGNPPACR